MLQQHSLNRRALASIDPGADAAVWSTMNELDAEAERLVAALRTKRSSLARSPWERLCCWLDERVRTDELESLDRPEHPERAKLHQVRLLHMQNLLLRSYLRYRRALEPIVAEARALRGGDTVRVLELASGDGNMAIAIADEAARLGLPMEVTGSDVVPAYVARAKERARSRGSRARFRVIDAFALDAIAPGEHDVVFMAQSAHHFSPGKLSVLIAQAERAGASHAVIIDGHRSARMLLALPLLASLSMDRHFTGDALLSTRRFYSEPELALLARTAAPTATITIRTEQPLTTVLTVAFANKRS
jgi:SAM-dependent methyltransferase